MKRMVNPDDFPASRKSAYLNTVSVTLMDRGVETAAVKWMADLATDSTITFDEAAEDSVFGGLHCATAQLLNAHEEDIADGIVGLGGRSRSHEQHREYRHCVSQHDLSLDLAGGHAGAEVRFPEGQREYVDPDEVIESIDHQTAVICISHVEYSGGQQYYLTRLARCAHEHGALLVVDGAQSLGAIPTDVTASGVDALAASGYKWLC